MNAFVGLKGDSAADGSGSDRFWHDADSTAALPHVSHPRPHQEAESWKSLV